MLMSDPTSEVLHAALRGLAQSQRVTADNIANIQTPGFLAGKVDFETSLREAVNSGDSADAMDTTVSTTRDWQTPVNTNGNNVNLDDQTVQATKDGLQYDLAVRALDDRYALMRSAMRSN